MTSVWVNLTFSALFVLLGAVNVWLIFHASRTITGSSTNQRLIRAHRVGGYLFIALFCAMTYLMLLRSAGLSEELSLRATIHVLIAMSLVPLLFVKVLIARYYKTFYSALTSTGLLIFSLAFILVAPIAVVDGLRTGFVEFTRSGKTCDIPAEATLLEVAERNGVIIPYSCRQGQCGTCATKLVEGVVQMGAEAGLTEELRGQGYVLPCVSRARGDIKLET
jgi:ferredoxin